MPETGSIDLRAPSVNPSRWLGDHMTFDQLVGLVANEAERRGLIAAPPTPISAWIRVDEDGPYFEPGVVGYFVGRDPTGIYVEEAF